MESIDARSFFNEFSRAMKSFLNASYIISDRLNHVGYTKTNRSAHTTVSTVELQAIEKALLVDNLANDLGATLELIKQGFELISTVGTVLGTQYADILTFRYAEGFSLRLIAKSMRIGKTTVERKLEVALDWLDSMPESYVKSAKGIAEKL